jgi:hypothetical protein
MHARLLAAAALAAGLASCGETPAAAPGAPEADAASAREGEEASGAASAREGEEASGAASAREGGEEAAGSAREGPPGARWDTVDMLRESLALVHHPADGGGRAWLEAQEPEVVRATSLARFTLVFEVGPLGIASGGSLYFQVSPFWGWSTPQVEAPDAPGYTTVEGPADDAGLEATTLDQTLLGIRVTGRALAPGERVRIVYGSGSGGARVDRFAEREARLWFAVDGDGDGVRKVLADSPGVEVRAGPPARMVVTLPSVARPGETVPVTLAVLDPAGSAGVEVAGSVTLSGGAPVLELPERVVLRPEDGGVARVSARVLAPGIARVQAAGPDGLEATSNPLSASPTGPRVLWADLHGHSSLSDGTGTPEDYFRYARDVAGLDVAALTDHDHWGMLPLDASPEQWQRIRRAVEQFHEPGRFVTLLGFEWTSWIHGHRHVLWFRDEGQVVSSPDPRTESPTQLWQALEGQPALTFAHHSAGGPVPTNWEIPPDPRFEPVTEIVSVHGSSEALDSPQLIYDPVEGNFVRDVLDRGYRLGFIGSGDSHDGHPGLAQLASVTGGLAAIVAEECTREAVLAALRARRVYATNGARILLRVALGPHPMGATARVAPDASLSESLFIDVVAEGPLERVELVRSGAVVDGTLAEGLLEATFQRDVSDLRPGEYIYVRVVQEDGGAAWSSPIFVEAAVP